MSEPKEPLIEDEKIRKCVKLWTELNGYGKSLMYAEGDNWGDNWCSFYELLDDEELLFRKQKCANLQNRKVYTIAELCGEEDEPKEYIEVVTKEHDHADAVRIATENLCGEDEE